MYDKCRRVIISPTIPPIKSLNTAHSPKLWFFTCLYRELRDTLVLLSGMLGTYLNILVSGLPQSFLTFR